MRLLTFNCHEPYLYDLAKLGGELVVIDGLPGRRTASWDTRARPVPANVELVSIADAGRRGPFDAVVAHNLTDLLAAREVHAPKVFVVHVNLRARIAEEGGNFAPSQMAEDLSHYLDYVGGVAVGVSEQKLASWGLRGSVIRPGVDPEVLSAHDGSCPRGLRVANLVSRRKKRFAWDVHLAITEGHEVDLVGDDPELGSRPAQSFDELRALYQGHRYYVHTADPELEDGYNLALLEAMATGMPVVANFHPSSPVMDGVSGFVSEDPLRLRADIGRLLRDPGLASELGRAARQTVCAEFSLSRFLANWRDALERARAAFVARHGPPRLAT